MPLPSFEYRPRIPKTQLRIGVIGAGGIVQGAHLPGYLKAGFRVSAICDIKRETAEVAATRFEIPNIATYPMELIEREDVDVVDLAIPDEGRLELVRTAATLGKHILIQKPLACRLEEAEEMVSLARDAGIKLAVNQNARWAPEFRAAKSLLESGCLGSVYHIRWEMRNNVHVQPWAHDSWYSKEPRFQLLLWSIHHLDLIRFWMGDEPQVVFASIPKTPHTTFRGETSATAILNFSGGRQAIMVDNNASIPGRDVHQSFVIEGSDGIVEGDVAHPRHFEVRLGSEPGVIYRPPLEGEWYPDGFAGSMGDLLVAIDEGRDPQVTGEDHLKTLRLVEACYRSAEHQAAVIPQSV